MTPGDWAPLGAASGGADDLQVDDRGSDDGESGVVDNPLRHCPPVEYLHPGVWAASGSTMCASTATSPPTSHWPPAPLLTWSSTDKELRAGIHRVSAAAAPHPEATRRRPPFSSAASASLPPPPPPRHVRLKACDGRLGCNKTKRGSLLD